MLRWLSSKLKKNQVVPINLPPLPLKGKPKGERVSTALIKRNTSKTGDSALESFREQPEGSEEIYKALNIDQPPASIWEDWVDAKASPEESQKLILKIVQWVNETIEKDKHKKPLTADEQTQDSDFNFHNVPAISIQAYLERLNKFICQGPSDLIMAFFYLNRYLELHPKIPLTAHNIHTLLFMSVSMANLMYADDFYSGEHLASVGGIATKYNLALMSAIPNSGPATNTIYLDFDNGSLKYKLSTPNQIQEITRGDLNKIIGKDKTDFIYIALAKAPFNSNMLQNLGYKLSPKTRLTVLEKGHLYVEAEPNLKGLKYTVITPSGQTKTGVITAKELPALQGKIKRTLDMESLKPLLPSLLKFTEKQDHTLSLRDEILKVTAKRGDTHTFAQVKNAFFREMDSSLYIAPELFEKARETLLAEPKASTIVVAPNTSRTRFKLLPGTEGSKERKPKEHQKTHSTSSISKKL